MELTLLSEPIVSSVDSSHEHEVDPKRLCGLGLEGGKVLLFGLPCAKVIEYVLQHFSEVHLLLLPGEVEREFDHKIILWTSSGHSLRSLKRKRFETIIAYRTISLWPLDPILDVLRQLAPRGSKVYVSVREIGRSMDLPTPSLRSRKKEFWARMQLPKLDNFTFVQRGYFFRDWILQLRGRGFTHISYAWENGLIGKWLNVSNVKVSDTYFELLFHMPRYWYVASLLLAQISSVTRLAFSRLFGTEFTSMPRIMSTIRYLAPCANSIVTNRSDEIHPITKMALSYKRKARFNRQGGLKGVVEKIVNGDSEVERFESIVRFVQQSLFRHPVYQPLGADGGLPSSDQILLSGMGRCGHAVKLLSSLLGEAGFESSLIQLPKHVTLKAKVSGDWLLAEADAFKNGIFPKHKDGRWIKMEEILSDPRILDQFPTVGWALSPMSLSAGDQFGSFPSGYVDAIPISRRGFFSNYWGVGETDFHVEPPEVEIVSVCSGIIKLKWLAQGMVADFLVQVGTSSRGWDYSDLSKMNSFNFNFAADLCSLQTTRTDIEIDLKGVRGKVYCSITPRTKRVYEAPSTFFWPSQEVVLRL